MLKRIHILGGPGSGKSTAARRLSTLIRAETYDLDDIFWDSTQGDYSTKVDKRNRDSALAEIVSKESWVIEGVYYAWVAPSLKRADMVVVLTTPVWVRHWRLTRRFLRRKLGLESITRHESFGDLIDLLRWNHDYDEKNLKSALTILRELSVKVVMCRNIDTIVANVHDGRKIRGTKL